MARQGYAGMTMAAVAEEAGVTKPTLYLRFTGKEDLATAALAALAASEPTLPLGNARSRLVAFLEHFRRSLGRPDGMALIGTLLAEERQHPELIGHFRTRILAPRRARLRALLEEGVTAGELGSGIDLDAAVNLLIGSFYARHLTGDPPDATWPERVVSTVWNGVTSPTG